MIDDYDRVYGPIVWTGIWDGWRLRYGANIHPVPFSIWPCHDEYRNGSPRAFSVMEMTELRDALTVALNDPELLARYAD